MTYDNGNEFSGYSHTAHRLYAQIVVARPDHAGERGVNEHTNGLIRDRVPTGTDFSTIPPALGEKVERVLNGRPRKSLECKTPTEVFHALAKRG
ncbi:MAG: hypothetical protein ABI604_04730 [Nitrospirota bacterium]